MKFSVVTNRMQTLFVTECGTFDGVPPVAHLDVAHSLPRLNADRVAVGLSLIYCHWLSGPVQFPEPPSALTAQRLTHFFGERFVTASPVTDRPQALPRGRQTVAVVDDATGRAPQQDRPTIRLVSFDHHEGSVWSGSQFTVPSNIHLLTGTGDSAWQPGMHTLGLATLLAEDIDASVLAHPAGAEEPSRLGQLLESVGLGLTVSSGA